MTSYTFILCSLLLCLGQISCVTNPKVVCYYENWYVWRTGDGRMTVDDVDNTLCTHLVYAYIGVSSTGEIIIPDKGLMVDQRDFTRFTANKGKSQALVAIGGYTLSPTFGPLVADATSRGAFVRNTVSFLQQYNFDGITIDWSRSTWTEDDFANFAKLLETFHTVFAGKYTLGITVSSHPENFNASHINNFVDFISAQTYDYHGPWEPTFTGHEAAINDTLGTLEDWEAEGADYHKLLMTLPLYAHTWILAGNETGPGAPASGIGPQGPWSQADGKLSYNELCLQMKEGPNEWQIVYDTELIAMYAINHRTNAWVSFESAVTAKAKTQTITSMGYGGVVAQALENDDFKGLCGLKYPILKGINAGLNTDPVTRPPLTTFVPTKATPDPTQICQKTGTVVDPKDCNTYHECTEFFPGILEDNIKHCPTDEGFDEKDLTCKNKTLVAAC